MIRSSKFLILSGLLLLGSRAFAQDKIRPWKFNPAKRSRWLKKS